MAPAMAPASRALGPDKAQALWNWEEGPRVWGKTKEATTWSTEMTRTWAGRGVRGRGQGVPGGGPACANALRPALKAGHAGQSGARMGVGPSWRPSQAWFGKFRPLCLGV